MVKTEINKKGVLTILSNPLLVDLRAQKDGESLEYLIDT